MNRKLPVARAAASVEAVRKQLGGRSATELGAGELVSVSSSNGTPREGVVVHVRGEVLDVWLEDGPAEGLVRRTERSRTQPSSARRAALDAVAADARAFAALREGERVRFGEGDGGVGTLVEKCRWGALVRRGDGSIVGVGFRRLRAAPAPS